MGRLRLDHLHELPLAELDAVNGRHAIAHLQGSYRQPAQWSLSDEQTLSTGTFASRIIRQALLGTLVLLILQTCAQIGIRMHKYEAARRGNARVVTTELKKRSTDFDESAYGWAVENSNEPPAPQSIGQTIAAAVEGNVNAVERAVGADLDGDGDVGLRGSDAKVINEPLSV